MSKLTHKEMYELYLMAGLSKADAREALMMDIYGITFYKCIKKAINFGENLMPEDCVNIIISVYGNRILKSMKLETAFNKVYEMMKTVQGDPDKENIQETIEYHFT